MISTDATHNILVGPVFCRQMDLLDGEWAVFQSLVPRSEGPGSEEIFRSCALEVGEHTISSVPNPAPFLSVFKKPMRALHGWIPFDENRSGALHDLVHVADLMHFEIMTANPLEVEHPQEVHRTAAILDMMLILSTSLIWEDEGEPDFTMFTDPLESIWGKDAALDAVEGAFRLRWMRIFNELQVDPPEGSQADLGDG